MNTKPKSQISGLEADMNQMGRSYYCFCLENALSNICRARALVKGDRVDMDHELPRIETLLRQALDAS